MLVMRQRERGWQARLIKSGNGMGIVKSKVLENLLIPTANGPEHDFHD